MDVFINRMNGTDLADAFCRSPESWRWVIGQGYSKLQVSVQYPSCQMPTQKKTWTIHDCYQAGIPEPGWMWIAYAKGDPWRDHKLSIEHPLVHREGCTLLCIFNQEYGYRGYDKTRDVRGMTKYGQPLHFNSALTKAILQGSQTRVLACISPWFWSRYQDSGI
jgi:hypothetical protein